MIYIGIGILLCIVMVQTILLWNYERQVKDICRQLSFLMKKESNMLISKQINFGSIEELVDLLNEMLSKRRMEKNQYAEKEKLIANTYTNLSHDIRTPLTSLDGYVQLLEYSTNKEEQKRYITIIQERISSLKEMLEELFTFTKVKNEAYILELSPCCINRILKKVVFSYYEEWKQKEIEPMIQVAEEPIYINGNTQALQRVFQNIIKNALEHGGKEIKMLLYSEKEKVYISFGNWIENKEEIKVEQVFERFYKADVARSKNSTGLGLAIAKELVNKMNGTIQARIEENIFYIQISFSTIEKGKF